MKNGTLPIPERQEPPIYLSSELWFAFLLLFGIFFGMAISGFILIDNGHLNDCSNMKAQQNWIDTCYNLNNNVYFLFGLLGSIFFTSLVMYWVSKWRYP